MEKAPENLREKPNSVAIIVLAKGEAEVAKLTSAGLIDGMAIISRVIGKTTLPEPDWRDYYDAGPMLSEEQLVLRAASIAADKAVVVNHPSLAAGSIAYAWEAAAWLPDAYKNVTVVKEVAAIPSPSTAPKGRELGESGVRTADAVVPPEPVPVPAAPPPAASPPQVPAQAEGATNA